VPTYGYECTKCEEQFEVLQRITDAPLTIHEGCGGELRRLVYPVGIVFKGSGFHVNDYAKNGAKSAVNGVTPAEPTTDAKPETKTETKVETKVETKTETKTETKSASKPEPAATKK
jgi:putative FmdB family regulatory protein